MDLNFIFDRLIKKQPALRRPNFEKILSDYLPPAALPLLMPTLEPLHLIIKITPPRATKLGDYRPPSPPRTQHQITINNNLNPYAFLITLLHEIAHLHTHTQCTHTYAPHGNEWKNNFKTILKPYINQKIFADDVCEALKNHLNNIKASSCTDPDLMRTLDRYNPKTTHVVHLETLPENAQFEYQNRLFTKQNQRRTRYLCMEHTTQKRYVFHALAKVTPV